MSAFARGRFTWTVYGLVGYFAYMETVLGPSMPFLREELGLSYSAASLHFSAFAVGGVLIGLLGDRVIGAWGRRAVLWGGAGGMALGALALVASPVAFGTVPGAFVMGVFGALLLVTSQALLADLHGKWSAVALSESNVAASACAVAAPLLVGAFAASGLGWRAAIAPPVSALLLLAAISSSRTPAPTPGVPEGKPVEQPPRLPARYWAFWGLLALGISAEWCIGYWGADFLSSGTGLSRPGAATALTVFFAAMLTGRVLGSRLARRLQPTVLLSGTLCLALAGFPLLWLSGEAVPAVAGLFATGLGIGSVYPLGVSAALAAAAPRGTDAAAARLAVAGGGAILVAPFALGALADRIGIQTAFGIVVPMLLVAVTLALVAGRLSREGP